MWLLSNIIKNFTQNKDVRWFVENSTIFSVFSWADSKIYDLALCDSDVVSCICIIWENIGIGWLKLLDKTTDKLIDKDWNNQDYEMIETIFNDIKWDFVKHKSIWGIVYFVKLINKKWDLATYKCYGKNQVTKSWSDYNIVDPLLWRIKVTSDNVYPILFFTWPNHQPLWIVETIKKDLEIENESATSALVTYRNKLRIWAIIKTNPELGTDPVASASLWEKIQKIFSWSNATWSYYLGNGIDDVKIVDLWIDNKWLREDRNFKTDKVCSAYNIPKELIWYTQASWSEAKIKWLYDIFMRTTIPKRDNSIETAFNKMLEYFLDLPQYKIKVWSETKLTTEEQENIRKNLESWIITVEQAQELLKINN